MSKPRAKLSPQQKQWLENLVWYSKNCIDWGGPETDFKEVVEAGRYAIFTKRHDTWDKETEEWVVGGKMVLGAPDEYSVDCMIKWNCDEKTHVVDLESLMVVKEVYKPMNVSLANYVAKLNSVSQLIESRP
jgi:hypothetical protein